VIEELKRATSGVATLVVATLGLAQQPFNLDMGFRTSIQQVSVNSVLPLPDGNVLISGMFRYPGDASWRTGARLMQDGALDPTFPAYPSMGGRITPWQDKIYVGLSQTVRRLLLNGNVDPSFQHLNANAPLFSSLQGGDYHVYPDGRIVISGAHTLNDPEHGFVGLYNLIWFTNTGQLDTTKHHRRCDEVLFEFEEQPDGKFLCSGTMTEYEGVPVSPVFRVHPDGGLDPSFSPVLQSWGGAYKFLTLADGRILAGGLFKLPGNDTIYSLLRFMPDGSIDPTFNLLDFGVAFNPNSDLPSVRDIHLLSDGRMIVTGWFDRIDGQTRGGIAMLSADGALLPGVFEGEGCGMYNYNGTLYLVVAGIAPSSDGSYYIHGAYHGYDDGTTNDPTQRFVSRLYGLDVGVREHEEISFTLYPNPASASVTLELGQLPAASVLLLRDALGREVLRERVTTHQHTLGLHGLGSGVYLMELWSKGRRVGDERVVVE
jgi:uncharacterized delta-60 repeat protein